MLHTNIHTKNQLATFCNRLFGIKHAFILLFCFTTVLNASSKADSTLEKEFAILKLNYNYKNIQNTILKYNAVAQKAMEAENYNLACIIYFEIGRIYWSGLNEYGTSIEYFSKTIEMHKLLPNNTYPFKLNDLSWLARGFYIFKDYNNALKYSKEALIANAKCNIKTPTNDVYNTIGLCFEKLENIDSSNYYYQLAIKENPKDKNTIWEGIVNGNIGYNLYIQKKYDQAIPLLKSCIYWGEKYNDFLLASGSVIPLATIYLKQGKLDLCETEIKKAWKCIKPFSNNIERFEDYYILLSKYYIVKGNNTKAIEYLDSANYYKIKTANKFNVSILLSIQQIKEINERKLELASLNSEKEESKLQRNFLILITTLGLIGYIFYSKLQRKKFALEKEAQEALINQNKKDLLDAELNLEEFRKNITEKTALLEQIQNKVSKDEDTILQKLKQNVILTEKQWNNFQVMFEKVQPNYLQEIKIKYATITQAELRYLALAKLNLSNKEMSVLQGISQQTVRVTLHRLKKKLHPDDDILNLIDTNV